MRIVLDTNVFVSALISREGPSGQVLNALKNQERFALITSQAQIAELRNTLEYTRLRKRISVDDVNALLRNINSVAELVTDLPDVDLSPDPDDNPIIATAIAGMADVLVSGDKRHMLALGEAGGIPIIDPRTALLRIIS